MEEPQGSSVQIELILYHIVQHIDQILASLHVLYCCILPVFDGAEEHYLVNHASVTAQKWCTREKKTKFVPNKPNKSWKNLIQKRPHVKNKLVHPVNLRHNRMLGTLNQWILCLSICKASFEFQTLEHFKTDSWMCGGKKRTMLIQKVTHFPVTPQELQQRIGFFDATPN